ncbi:hypothetical protein GCM10011613_22870 [Cellvibrio zantedeschiae]|uniref:Phosphodiester glycosidase domain-containing protein n=1 Tax=Cellvibrio zantedeschiae TaxID=1237077 RepID=A0ABQ3B6Q3_9GAMM|nr:phosphodiester glycosidase family protein [Cellvibrio zantedeschiae]GGY77724.1 hypothetical protein GCM10011613_22870 [Cellvibrio zantedeschiae]
MKLRYWVVLSVLAAFCIGLYSYSHWYGFNVLLRRGGTFWTDVKIDDPRLSASMRLALRSPDLPVVAGELKWQVLAEGFETAELSVLANGLEVDRIMLNRIDPKLYSFSVLNAPKGNRGLAEWESALPTATLIVNGSYFDRYGLPSTPFISEGRFLGIKPYDAKAGAFVADSENAAIVDLSGQMNWETAFKNAQNAMVSFPLLVGEDGQNHVHTASRWLANRTFVAQDRQGRVLVGTTADAFFSIHRLGEFLRTSPLDIKVALNLDGGPVACQSVRIGNFHRHFIAKWELQADQTNNHIKLLTWPFGSRGSWAMGIVLTATPKVK